MLAAIGMAGVVGALGAVTCQASAEEVAPSTELTGGVFTGASVPEARLVGTTGRIHHFKGPSWQSTRDGSRRATGP